MTHGELRHQCGAWGREGYLMMDKTQTLSLSRTTQTSKTSSILQKIDSLEDAWIGWSIISLVMCSHITGMESNARLLSLWGTKNTGESFVLDKLYVHEQSLIQIFRFTWMRTRYMLAQWITVIKCRRYIHLTLSGHNTTVLSHVRVWYASIWWRCSRCSTSTSKTIS